MVGKRTERLLIEDFRSGQPGALERVLDTYEDKVFALVYRMVGAADAEDVAQDALVEICKSISTFRGSSSLATWVYRVAANVCLQHRRKHAPQTVPLEEDIAGLAADPSPGPESETLRNETRSQVDAAVESLPPMHRDVVILHELHGLTYRECAGVLQCPVGTVKSRLSSAFRKLRELLRDHAFESGV